jgi:glycosyltransferase involved in cell wall biosynthesis
MLTPRVHLLVDTLGVGGAELLLTQYARLGGVEISVACLKDTGAGHVAERLRASGIEPRCVGIGGHLGPSAFLRVRRHLAEVRPALVHTHLSYADLLGGPAARSLGIPTVATLHSHAPPSTPRERVRARMTDIARRSAAARVIAVSRSARDACLASGGDPERIVVLHNAIGERPRPGSGAAVRRELGLAQDDLVVAMLSSLRPEKGHDVALEAMALLLPRFPALRLLVIGDGPLRARIQRAAAPLGDRAVLAGYRPDAMAALDAADVLLHPSRRDTLPTAILEAMACSLPVVATGVGGIGELVIDGETGSLVAPPLGASRVAGALAPVLDDPGLRRRMGAAGHARFEAEFSVDRWARRMRDVYVSVLDGAR